MATATTDDIRRWRDDPLLFIGQVWPSSVTSDKQAEIAESVRDNYGTIVHSGVESGKDWITARLILWFYLTRFPCKLLATSVSDRQLTGALWGELGNALRTAKVNLGLDYTQTKRIRRLDQRGRPYENDWATLAQAKDIEGFAGYHLPEDIPRVMVIFDEASGVRTELCESAEGIAHRILSIGNPMNTAGYFARKIKRGDVQDELTGHYRWRIIHIDCEDTPNVVAGKAWAEAGGVGQPPTVIPGMMSYANFIHRTREWDEFMRQTKLHGLLPEGSHHVCVPYDWLEESFALYQEVNGCDRGPYWMGIDCAKGGRDKSAWAIVDRFGLAKLVVKDTPDTVELMTTTLALMSEFDIPGARVAVDAAGGDESIVHPLRRKRIKIMGVSFGSSPTTPARKKIYSNMRAELFCEAAKAISPDGWIRNGDEWQQVFTLNPSDPDARLLAEEISSIPKVMDSRDKIKLPPKQKVGKSTEITLRDILGHSPDRSDALVLALWLMRGKAGRTVITRDLVYS
jgi:hypothetical protein